MCFTHLQAEAGFRCSAGISSNRMLAKLVSGLHKPDDQTVLLPPDALDFVGPLPVRALPGTAPASMGVHGSVSGPFGAQGYSAQSVIMYTHGCCFIQEGPACCY